MAGFVISISKKRGISCIEKCIKDGVYSTKINVSAKQKTPFFGTLADYCSMQEGDNIFFFCNRKIYGTGRLVKIGPDVKLNNYPRANSPYLGLVDRQNAMLENTLVPFDEGPRCCWICTFVPSESFYRNGVDMDEVLEYKPTTFKSLRTFWKKSFIKIDDEENESLKEFILLHGDKRRTFQFDSHVHELIKKKSNNKNLISASDSVKECSDDSHVKNEMAIECLIVDQLARHQKSPLGDWDYVTHQVCASPFKPIDYMDKIDVFGYRYLSDGKTKVISKFLIIELKKGSADNDTIAQVSKYVDWVCRQYAYGDYGMIEAFIIAYDYPGVHLSDKKTENTRNYSIGSHPTKSLTWDNIRFFKYSASPNFDLKEIDPLEEKPNQLLPIR